MSGFDEIWAVDWSGARARPRGIAVAKLADGSSCPVLSSPDRGGAWTRAGVVAALSEAIRGGRRVLAGFDFAFGFPQAVLSPLGLSGRAGLPELWEAVDRICATAPDLHGGPFVEAAPHGLFWRSGRQPDGWSAALRLTDTRCATIGGVRPESVMKLIGPKQVGLAALSGMRSLAALRQSCGPDLSIWPVSPPGAGSVAVEIFPTLYRRRATGRLDKIRDMAGLVRALAHWGCEAPRLDRVPTDDETDALISAAGMRAAAGLPGAFALPDDPRVAREGWIFGLGEA
jgi:hypothetical protein